MKKYTWMYQKVIFVTEFHSGKNSDKENSVVKRNRISRGQIYAAGWRVGVFSGALNRSFFLEICMLALFSSHALSLT